MLFLISRKMLLFNNEAIKGKKHLKNRIAEVQSLALWLNKMP